MKEGLKKYKMLKPESSTTHRFILFPKFTTFRIMDVPFTFLPTLLSKPSVKFNGE